LDYKWRMGYINYFYVNIMKKILIIHNIATSYYKNIVFNALYEQYEDFKLIYLDETQSNRDWEVDLSYLGYPHEVLFGYH